MSTIMMMILIMTKIMINISTHLWLCRRTSFHLLPNASAPVYHFLTLTYCHVTQISFYLRCIFPDNFFSKYIFKLHTDKSYILITSLSRQNSCAIPLSDNSLLYCPTCVSHLPKGMNFRKSSKGGYPDSAVSFSILRESSECFD